MRLIKRTNNETLTEELFILLRQESICLNKRSNLIKENRWVC